MLTCERVYICSNIGFRVWKIERDDEAKYSTFYLAAKAETIILDSEIDDVFDPSILGLYQTSKICS